MLRWMIVATLLLLVAGVAAAPVASANHEVPDCEPGDTTCLYGWAKRTLQENYPPPCTCDPKPEPW